MGLYEQMASVCEQTGVTIPECSCAMCIEDLLRRFQPELISGSGPDQLRLSTDELDAFEHGAAA